MEKEPSFKKIFGKYLRQIRLEMGMKQQEFADKAGVDVKQISRFESAKRLPSLETLAKLRKVPNFNVNLLLDLVNSEMRKLDSGNQE